MLILILLGLTGPMADETRIEKVEREARRYRIQVYERFRLERPEFDRRIAAGAEILDRWRAAKHPLADADAIEAWFADAQKLSRSDLLPPLPEITPPETGLAETDLGPAIDPTSAADERQVVITRESDPVSEQGSNPTESQNETPGDDETTWGPRPWRSLGVAVWNGFEESLQP